MHENEEKYVTLNLFFSNFEFRKRLGSFFFENEFVVV